VRTYGCNDFLSSLSERGKWPLISTEYIYMFLPGTAVNSGVYLGVLEN
jgi:hypothetical protein